MGAGARVCVGARARELASRIIQNSKEREKFIRVGYTACAVRARVKFSISRKLYCWQNIVYFTLRDRERKKSYRVKMRDLYNDTAYKVTRTAGINLGRRREKWGSGGRGGPSKNFRDFELLTLCPRASLLSQERENLEAPLFEIFFRKGCKVRFDETCRARIWVRGCSSCPFHFEIILKTPELILLCTFTRKRDA